MEVNLKDISKIIKEFMDVPYEGYVSKRYKHMPTESYLYLSIQIAKFIMSMQKMSNLHGLVRTQNMSTQKMNNLSIYSID